MPEAASGAPGMVGTEWMVEGWLELKLPLGCKSCHDTWKLLCSFRYIHGASSGRTWWGALARGRQADTSGQWGIAQNQTWLNAELELASQLVPCPPFAPHMPCRWPSFWALRLGCEPLGDRTLPLISAFSRACPNAIIAHKCYAQLKKEKGKKLSGHMAPLVSLTSETWLWTHGRILPWFIT